MYVTSPTPEARTIIDYEITFSSGQFMSFSIDETAGDTISFGDKTIDIYLAQRVAHDKDAPPLPAENIKIIMTHVLAIREVTKTFQPLSNEQKVEWQKAFDHASGRTTH